MVTLSMMVRVSLGHTARDFYAPPRAITYALAALGAGTMFRILLPLAFPSQYFAWILVSQIACIASVAPVAGVLLPILSAPRVDGRSDLITESQRLFVLLHRYFCVERGRMQYRFAIDRVSVVNVKP